MFFVLNVVFVVWVMLRSFFVLFKDLIFVLRDLFLFVSCVLSFSSAFVCGFERVECENLFSFCKCCVVLCLVCLLFMMVFFVFLINCWMKFVLVMFICLLWRSWICGEVFDKDVDDIDFRVKSGSRFVSMFEDVLDILIVDLFIVNVLLIDIVSVLWMMFLGVEFNNIFVFVIVLSMRFNDFWECCNWFVVFVEVVVVVFVCMCLVLCVSVVVLVRLCLLFIVLFRVVVVCLSCLMAFSCLIVVFCVLFFNFMSVFLWCVGLMVCK